LRWFRREVGGPDFAIDLGAGLRLPRRVAIGGALHWNLEGGVADHVAFDASLSWRPLPWIGASLISRNIGGPGADQGAPAQTGGSVAVRPIGRALVLGTDLMYTFDPDQPRWSFAASLRVRPIEGLYLRARLDTRLHFAAGVELFFGPGGVGAMAAGGRSHADVLAYVGSDEPGERLLPSRRQVPVLQLDHPPPYAPDRRLLSRTEMSWLEVLQALDEAANSRERRAAVISLGDVDLGWARWRELRARLTALTLADKHVVAHLHGDVPTGAVYAASGASEVLVQPGSVIDLSLPAVEEVNLRGLLDMTGVSVQVARSGPYKSASEALTDLEPSAWEREQQLALLRAVTDELVTAIAQGRRRPEQEVRDWLTRGPVSAAEAAHDGIVDGLAWYDELDGAVSGQIGMRAHLVELARRPRSRSPWDPPVQIAVVYLDGTMVDGRSGDGGPLGGARVGAQTVVKQLERARRDPGVRAVVLRVDTPGGTTHAAEEIGHAVDLLRRAGKPVVASLGDKATSGGYYVAAGADAIWAEPTTITGSIGVIATHVSVPDLLDRLGVHTTVLREGPGPDATSPLRRWDTVEQARVQALVDAAYQGFIDHVASGRSLTPDAVDAIGRGRVWSGVDARSRALVDHTGGMIEAIAHARQLAGIAGRTPTEVVTPRAEPRLGELLLPDLSRLRLQALGVPDLASGLSATLLGTLLPLLQEDRTPWMIEPDPLRITPR
ncbi:MAG TPA: signal peptide peptidase SppA, partial [Myxococcota bacterium]|nr:signal peptide peptidase SppA [Myxococcota bacterium]